MSDSIPPSARFDLDAMAVLAVLAAAPSGLAAEDVIGQLALGDIAGDAALTACEALLMRNAISAQGDVFELTSDGARELLAFHAAIENALDPSPTTAGMEECPSIPWLTTVQTHWIDAVSLNYAVDPDALSALLPAPLEPELHRGTAWVQLLVSRLREMRPQGAPALFGVSFHQASYRAAVRYKNARGAYRRGGYFIRSETDHTVMRTIGNALVEFRFHDFGRADMSLAREGSRLALKVAPTDAPPHGGVDVEIDTRDGQSPPSASVWRSLEELHEPLVVCHDAFGVDPDGWLYVLTIDREAWNERFATAKVRTVEYFETGPLGAGASRLDSALHVPHPCSYKWRPLRRERWLKPRTTDRSSGPR
jgi:uncharacterized protein YqjF (DUF2071 family)